MWPKSPSPVYKKTGNMTVYCDGLVEFTKPAPNSTQPSSGQPQCAPPCRPWELQSDEPTKPNPEFRADSVARTSFHTVKLSQSTSSEGYQAFSCNPQAQNPSSSSAHAPSKNQNAANRNQAPSTNQSSAAPTKNANGWPRKTQG
ncbi:hypothetical protein NMY22_g882 [Coprinellus aureogranulatus]|nr:hypothetical protein NMY22_g882 [Coprinellus aureogranulatus]